MLDEILKRRESACAYEFWPPEMITWLIQQAIKQRDGNRPVDGETNTSPEREAEIRAHANGNWKNGQPKIDPKIPSFTRDLLGMLDAARGDDLSLATEIRKELKILWDHCSDRVDLYDGEDEMAKLALKLEKLWG